MSEKEQGQNARDAQLKARLKFINTYTRVAYRVLNMCPPLGSMFVPYELGKKLGKLIRKAEARDYVRSKVPEYFRFQDYVQYICFCIDQPANIPAVQDIIHTWIDEKKNK